MLCHELVMTQPDSWFTCFFFILNENLYMGLEIDSFIHTYSHFDGLAQKYFRKQNYQVS